MGITTINNGQSDHSMIAAIYHTKAAVSPPKIIFTRPKYLLTEHTMNENLKNNDIIQTAFNYTAPDLIAEIIMNEYNNIIEIIAPKTKRQVRKDYTPYLNKETRQEKHNLQKLHTKAKQTEDSNDWREYKNNKATLNKKINKQKTEYINKKLDKSSDRWKTLKEINNTKSFRSPRSITNKDKITTNIKEICNIANNFYINSIRKLRENIPKIMTTPVEILKKIYPGVETKLEIPIPTIKDIM